MSARDKLRAKNEERKHNLTEIQNTMTSVVDDIMDNLPVDDKSGDASAENKSDTTISHAENTDNSSISDNMTSQVKSVTEPLTKKFNLSENDNIGEKSSKSRSHEKTQTNPKGAGRPFNEVPKTVTSFSLCELSLRQLKELSMDNRVGMNRIVEIAVSEYMKKMDPDSSDRLQKKWGYEINPELSGESYIKL